LTSVRLRPIVPGKVHGRIVKVGSLSFYGEVDPERGVLIGDGRSLSGRVLFIGRSRGSTVGSYVIYALRYYGNAPAAIVMVESEPIVITGAILAGIPLFEGLPREMFSNVKDGDCADIDNSGVLNLGGDC